MGSRVHEFGTAKLRRGSPGQRARCWCPDRVQAGRSCQGDDHHFPPVGRASQGGRLPTTRCGRMIEDYYDFEQSVNHPRGPRWWPQIARFDGWGALRRGCPVGRPWRDRFSPPTSPAVALTDLRDANGTGHNRWSRALVWGDIAPGASLARVLGLKETEFRWRRA